MLFLNFIFQMHPDNGPHLVLVISPLKSLMFDQVTRWSRVGIESAMIMPKKEMDKDIIQGMHQTMITGYK